MSSYGPTSSTSCTPTDWRSGPHGEVVLSHPMLEALGTHGPAVLDPETVLGVMRSGPPSNREGHLLLDPRGQLRVDRPRERDEHKPGHMTVALDVVAGAYGEPAASRAFFDPSALQ